MWETLNIVFICIGNIFDYCTAEQKQLRKKVRNIRNARQKCKKLSLQKEISAYDCLRLYFRMNLANFPHSDLPYFHLLYHVQEYLQMHISHEVGSKFGSIFSCYKDIDVFFLTCLMNSVNHKSFLMETTCLPRTV